MVALLAVFHKSFSFVRRTNCPLSYLSNEETVSNITLKDYRLRIRDISVLGTPNTEKWGFFTKFFLDINPPSMALNSFYQ